MILIPIGPESVQRHRNCVQRPASSAYLDAEPTYLGIYIYRKQTEHSSRWAAARWIFAFVNTAALLTSSAPSRWGGRNTLVAPLWSKMVKSGTFFPIV